MNGAAYKEFFCNPLEAWHRRYEALRSVFAEEQSPQDVARRIGVSYGTLRNWVSEFRRQCDRGMRPPFSPRRRADGRRAAAAANARRSTRPTSACCP